MDNKENNKPITIDSLRYARNRFEKFKVGLRIGDVTASFLKNLRGMK
jgi:hypothetical protein